MDCVWMSVNLFSCGMDVSYRVNDSPQGLESSPYRKHVLHSVCNSCELEKNADTETCDCILYAISISSISFCGSYLGLVELFDPYTVNNGSHRPGPLSLKNRTNRPEFRPFLVEPNKSPRNTLCSIIKAQRGVLFV